MGIAVEVASAAGGAVVPELQAARTMLSTINTASSEYALRLVLVNINYSSLRM